MDHKNPNARSVPAHVAPQKRSDSTVVVMLAESLKQHWPEYLLEAIGLGLFMFSACAFTVLLFHPGSVIAASIDNEVLRRALMGVAMGGTAIAIVFSPIGRRSGAHINPSVTLTFLRLGKVGPCDAAFYTLFQFVGAVAGALLASWLMGEQLAHQSVSFAVTVPGPAGVLSAFIAEISISFLLMLVVLIVSSKPRLSRWTGLFAGFLVASYITLESPVSGMSMNPARTFGTAAVAGTWTGLWIYFTAPPLGMLLAAELYLKVIGQARTIACAKLRHHNTFRCIFSCNPKLDSV
jgi:aquaporin Z